jgi:hypothetical protein
MTVVTSTAFPDGNINIMAPLASQGAQSTEAERRALGLTLFAGEVMRVFYDTTFTDGKVRKIVINEGISAQFPHTGVVQGGFHKAGTPITINTAKQAARTITIDDIIYAANFFPIEYDLIGHLGSACRAAYAEGAGRVIAESMDTMNFAEIIKAARSAALITGETDGGSEIISDSFKIGVGGAANEAELANALFQAIFAAADIFDQKKIPYMARQMVLKPYHYNLLVRAIMENGFSLSNADYMSMRADINNATLPPIAGIQIGKSNMLPSTNLTATGDASGGTPNTLASIPVHTNHTVDASKTIGLIWTPECVGNVVRQGLASKMSEELTHLGQLNVTYMLCGGGVLRPECAIELKLDNLSN